MSISTYEANLVEYADFEEAGSVARAKLFITNAKRWLILRAESASNQSSSLSIGKSYVQEMMRRAQDYVAANASTASGGQGGVRFLGVGSNFR